MKLFVKLLHECLLIAFYINDKLEGTRHTIGVFESRYVINFNIEASAQPFAFVWRDIDERLTDAFQSRYAKQRLNNVAWWSDFQVIDGKVLEMKCLGGARCFAMVI